MRLYIFLLVQMIGGLFNTVLAQNYFEGELDYRNAFIDKQSYDRLYEDVSLTATVKGGKYKLNVNQKGKINWQIDDFENGHSYEYKDYMKTKVPTAVDSVLTRIEINLPRTDSTLTRTDSTLTGTDSALTRMDSTLKRDSTFYTVRYDTLNIAMIHEMQLCTDSTKLPPPPHTKFISGLRLLDTMMVIAGLNCHVMEDLDDGVRIAEYYYCDSIKINPIQYSCFRTDRDDRLYKFNNGSLITKRILYDIDNYIYVMELQAIRPKEIGSEAFELPKDLQVIPLNKQ